MLKFMEQSQPAANLKQPIMMIGLMGSGKTVIGKMLAQKLGLTFTDTDKLIEDEAGLRITDIFELYGEAKFREMERRIITSMISKEPQIISVGGGAFCQPEIRQAVKGKIITLWLRAEPQTLLSRMDNLASRPLLAGDNPLGILQDLQKKRFPDYAQADLIVDTDGLSKKDSLQKVAQAIDAYLSSENR